MSAGKTETGIEPESTADYSWIRGAGKTSALFLKPVFDRGFSCVWRPDQWKTGEESWIVNVWKR